MVGLDDLEGLFHDSVILYFHQPLADRTTWCRTLNQGTLDSNCLMYGAAPAPLAESSVILVTVAPKLSQTCEGHRADFITPVTADHNEE